MYRNKFSYITGFAIMILFISGFTYVNSLNEQKVLMNQPMDFEEYKNEWQKVDSLINNGLPKSALELTETIYENARLTNNHPQFIKATLYKIRLISEFEEEFMENTVDDLRTEIAEAKTPAKQILHSLLADIYWQYYQINRHKFFERSLVIGVDMDDIRTWDLNTLMDVIINNYFASLEDPDILKATNLKDYDAIIDTASGSKQYRPTLYDFLTHRAVDFFINDESSIIQPAYRFELDKESFFAAPDEFSKISFQVKDSLSLKFHAIQIFQDLIFFHLNDEEPTALTDVNLKRLKFVHRYSIHPENDSLYLQSLLDYENAIRVYSSSTEVSFEMATEYYRQSSKYNPLLSDNYRWEARKAKDKCVEAVERFPESDGAKKCENLLQRISKSSFRITTEKENLPDQSILSLLSYKNLSNLHFRLVKIDFKEHRSMLREVRQKKERIEKYISMSPLNEWTQTLLDEGDFQEHKTEIKIPALDAGFYILLVTESDMFTPDSHSISYQTFWVTRISFISLGTLKGGYGLYILDRESGAAMKDVDVKLFYRTYNYQTRSYQYAEGGEFVSDEKGYFEIPSLAENEKPNSFFLEFNTKNDRLITGDRFYHSGYSPREDRKRITTYIFTDRAIYRPGQTIYFKGIVLEKYKDISEIKPGYNSKVELLDVNHQKVSELDLITNEYGSFQGSFVVPHGVLNGRMTIKTGSGSKSVVVEEYKRPNFEVVFNPVEGSYKLNESIKLTGTAKAFSGNNISGAEVKYRVVREVYYPWRFNYFRHFPVQSSMEITNGKTQTNENGKFIIEFEAIPDHTIPGKFKPIFRYTVYTDITDINHETQSGKTYVSVGSNALQIVLGIGEVENRESFSSIPIQTTNLNGQPVPASGRLVISLLEEPERLLREQLWQQPDVFVMEKEDFIKDFPYDSYMNENDPKYLKEKTVVKELDFDTHTDSVILLNDIQGWQPGRYVVKVNSKDEFGTDVELVKYFILFSTADKTPPVNELNWFYVLDNSCEPGENARFLMGTKDKQVRILYEIVHQEKVISSEWITLSNEQKLFEIPVTEEFRGGFKVNLLFVKHNRVFKNSFGIDVPYTNKKLDFEFISFRNKLIPGQKEEWSIRIKGRNGDKIAAELLTSMYDQSLDKFASFGWGFNILTIPYHGRIWNTEKAFHNTTISKFYVESYDHFVPVIQNYDRLNWFGFTYFGGNYYMRGGRSDIFAAQKGMPGKALHVEGTASEESMVENVDMEMKQVQADGESVPGILTDSIQSGELTSPQIRRDFRETAFFYPALRTDENGDVIISFTVPESLTRWKLVGLAHTKDLKYGQFSKEIITQKELMVIPNPPRFFRQNDQMEFAAKLVNLSKHELKGDVDLRFFHTATMKEITSEVVVDTNTVTFFLEKGASQAVSWKIEIPERYDVISFRVMARSESYSDGEEKPVPVLTNRMLVTESMPLPVKGLETKNFIFKKLINSEKNGSLVNYNLTLEFSSNPAWYAVQALPYMMEGTHESADNIFNRFYANTIALYIVNSNPRIKQVFDTWRNYSPDALLSSLEKNEELKSLILNETPWVKDAQNETERKQRIAILFDLNKMADEQATAMRKLVQKQSPGGGWPWFKGMPDNRNITQQIITGFGHLKQLGVLDAMENNLTKAMMIKALRYLDRMIKEDYDWLIEHKVDLDKNHLGNTQIQYLYSRAYFIDQSEISKTYQEAFEYYQVQEKKYWTKQGNYQKAMIALALNRYGDTLVPRQILASVKEYALYSDEMGMYWRDNRGGYFWYQAPIETQALLIEAFGEVIDDEQSVEQMKTWLLKQKQTQNWKTPRATADAVYALLLRGGEWLMNDKLAEITIGNQFIDPLELDNVQIEAGTGYFKTSWPGEKITPEMGSVTVKNENNSVAWGAVYWQYFEDLDKITFAETPLKLDKKLFVKQNTDTGPVLIPMEERNVKTGDMIIVRVELRVDRDMEYVHMKDMRASAFEPINVLSGYRYQGGLGYYESTLDASTNFFFDYLRKGTYVFEYPLVVSQKGEFSNGITTIQCMYAPEFTSHSEGVRVKVE